ncbi:MAG: DUF2877 domain-containing protein [Granulosicoccus sp.]
MPEPVFQLADSFDFSSVGDEAARIFAQHASGSVLAVFDSSAYLQCGSAVFCIAVNSIGPGPLHLLIDGEYSRLPFTLQRGQLVTFSSGDAHEASALRLGSSDNCARLHLTASDAHFAGGVPTLCLLPTAESVARCNEVLTGISSSSLPVKGFAWLLDDTHWSGLSVPTLPLSNRGSDKLSDSLNRQCTPAIVRLYRWLKVHGVSDNEAAGSDSALSGKDPAVHELLGAGPGLTPSGDDLLAGVLLTLRVLGRASTAAALWHFIESQCATQTNIISAAHLRLAAQGQCSDSMLQMLCCLLPQASFDHVGENADRAHVVQSLAERMGATSGWDVLAGVKLVIIAYTESVNRNKPNASNKTQL